ncbi:hypothetical protein KU15F66_33320 [Escherichia coli]
MGGSEQKTMGGLRADFMDIYLENESPVYLMPAPGLHKHFLMKAIFFVDPKRRHLLWSQSG